MSFSFQCPVCKSIRKAADHVYGKRVRCADCDNFVTVDDSTIVQPQQDFGLLDTSPGQSPDPSTGPPQAHESFDLAEPAEPTGNSSSTDYQKIAAAITQKTARPAPTPVAPVVSAGPRDAWKQEDPPSGGGQGPKTGSGDGDGDDFEEVVLPKGNKRTEDEMDMTPMVDVTFLLLIFFMVTASFTLQKSMDLPTKTQDEPSPNVVEDFEDNPEYVSVFVSPYNEYRVRTSEYDWEDAPNRHELRVRLTDALQAQSKPEKMLIMAHADCFHDKVIQAMDIGVELRYKIQVIMTEEEF
ncbi:MAG: biopolymer transporter ExbD [Planctomycetota bacterium]|nr:biopolymer transporter ExbD [Planctomycetota bacterium]